MAGERWGGGCTDLESIYMKNFVGKEVVKHLLSPSTKTHRGRAPMGEACFQVRSLPFGRQLPPDADSRPKGDGKGLLGWGCGWLLQSPPRGLLQEPPWKAFNTGGMDNERA